MRALVPLAAAVAVLVVCAAAAADGGATLATPGDPLAACTLGGDDFGGVVFPSTEPEVWLAASPADDRTLIGAIQQDRWSDGGAKGLVAPYSSDGGRTWKESVLPFTQCAAPLVHGHVLQYDRASDPWVDIGPDGTAYSISISFNGNDNAGAVGVATSSDGGRSWRNTQTIISESAVDPTLPFNDKESITADPVVPGTAYAVWDRLENVACPPGVPPPSHEPYEDERIAFRQAAGAAVSLDCFVGPTLVSVTRDFGRTWSKPKVIVPAPANEQTIANQVVVDPRTHTVYDFYMYFTADNVATVENVASRDGGRTWGRRQVVSESQTVGVTDPETGAPLRTGDIIPEPAVDGRTGKLYVVWQDPRFSHDPDEDGVVISSSSFGGLTGTWTSPASVNDRHDRAAFTPAIKVLDDGRVAVSYYALRKRDRSPDVLLTDVMLKVGGGDEQQLGDSFNMLAAPFAFGYFTGDYEGMAVSGKSIYVFSTVTNCRDASCAAVAGFDEDENPIPSSEPNSTDVFLFRPDRR